MGTAAYAWAPIHVDPANPHYFVFRGHPTVLISSGEHYGAILNEAWDAAADRAYLDTLHADGLNLTRVFSGVYREHENYISIGSTPFPLPPNTLGPIANQFLTPWARSDVPGYGEGDPAGGGNKFDLTRWDPAYFAKLRAFVAHADALGIAVEYTFFSSFYSGAAGGQWAMSPLNAANNINGIGNVAFNAVNTLDNGGLVPYQEALIRKVVSELAPYDNVYYEVVGEPYVDQGPSCVLPDPITGCGPDYTAWEERMTTAIQQAQAFLPLKHMVAWNVTGTITDPSPAVGVFNFHTAPSSEVMPNLAVDRPLNLDEVDFQGPADATYRTEAWQWITSGGAGYNNLDFSFTPLDPRGFDPPDTTSPAGAYWGGGPTLRRQLGSLLRFVDQLPLDGMRPDNGVILSGPAGGMATALVDPGNTYLVYLDDYKAGTATAPHSDSVTIGLRPGRYRVSWFDPASGREERSGVESSTNGRLTATSPTFSDDAALLITRCGSGARRAARR